MSGIGFRPPLAVERSHHDPRKGREGLGFRPPLAVESCMGESRRISMDSFQTAIGGRKTGGIDGRKIFPERFRPPLAVERRARGCREEVRRLVSDRHWR